MRVCCSGACMRAQAQAAQQENYLEWLPTTVVNLTLTSWLRCRALRRPPVSTLAPPASSAAALAKRLLLRLLLLQLLTANGPHIVKLCICGVCCVISCRSKQMSVCCLLHGAGWLHSEVVC